MHARKICVVGMGYIGLPTATVIASHRIEVVGLDVNAEIVEIINRGNSHIVEPGLDDMLQAAVADGHLRATTVPESADVFVVAVPTPFKDNHVPDLSYIEAACNSLAPVLKPNDLVILESTSPVGTTKQMACWLSEKRQDLSFPISDGDASDIRIAHCPERVLPGNILQEIVSNDRVIGGLSDSCSEAAVEFYQIFVEGSLKKTNAQTAEMCKLTENSFRDTNIAFANELSIICDKFGIDVWELIELANRHPRVNILQPGAGVGGHCIAVDPWFIVSMAGKEARLIREARLVNDAKPDWVVQKVREAVGQLKSSSQPERKFTIACLGLAFKPNIDDLRESPALQIVNILADELQEELLMVEPHIKVLPSKMTGRAQLVSLESAMTAADVVVMLVGHEQFRAVQAEHLTGKVVIDVCGFWR